MPSHRKERGPGPRHRVPGVLPRLAPSARAGLPARYRRTRYLRMLVATPQFAAGAGIVIAAVLAVDGPHAALSYGPNPPVHECTAQACAPAQPARGGLATSRPSIKLRPARPKAHRAALGTDQPAAVPGAGTIGTTANAGGRRSGVTLEYRTIQAADSGFIAMIIIESPRKLGTWTLTFRYAAAQVQHVWGAMWQPDSSRDGGVMTAQPWPWPGQKASTARIVIFASGPPASPASCSFDGAACSFS